jgi:hypothetical protein
MRFAPRHLPLTPINEAMYVQILHTPVDLTSPVIPLENSPVEYPVTLGVKLNSRAWGLDFLREAFCEIWDGNPVSVEWGGTGSSAKLN